VVGGCSRPACSSSAACSAGTCSVAASSGSTRREASAATAQLSGSQPPPRAVLMSPVQHEIVSLYTCCLMRALYQGETGYHAWSNCNKGAA
jgi:hypothetical protein